MAILWFVNRTAEDGANPADSILRADTYTQNQEKTTIQQENIVEDAISRTLQYTERIDKVEAEIENRERINVTEILKEGTDGAKLVSGINCSANNTVNEFMKTKNRFQKQFGIPLFHLVQSSPKDINDPFLVHQIGIEFAEKSFGQNFQVVVSTHVDKEHLHNHFVINSVSFKDGKKLHIDSAYYYELRRLNDELSLDNGLSITENPQRRRSSRAKDSVGWKNLIKTQVDEAISEAKNYYDFFEILKKKGYTFRKGNLQDISLRPIGREKNFRLAKNLGDEYTPEAIKHRIKETTIHQKTKNEQTDFKTVYLNQYKKFKYAYYRLHVPIHKKTFKARRYELASLYRRARNLMGLHRGPEVVKVPTKVAEYINGITEETILLSQLKIKNMHDLRESTVLIKDEISGLRKDIKNISRRIHADTNLLEKKKKQLEEKTSELKILERVEKRSQRVAEAETYNARDEKTIKSQKIIRSEKYE